MSGDEIRIGDRERDAAISKLQNFHAEGRLSVEEFEERVTQALSAKTATDLAGLFTDLPGGVQATSEYGPSPETASPYAATPYQDPYYQPSAYQPPAPQYLTPVNHQPPPGKAPLYRPWYAQWWWVVVAIMLTSAAGARGGFLIILAILWIWVIYPSIARSRQVSQPQRQLTYEERDQIMREIASGRKARATQLYRSMTGADPVAARYTIEAWSRGLSG